MRLAPDESASLFSGRNFELAGNERIYFTLYRCQQIDTGLRYMQGDDKAVSRFRLIAVQSASCFPPALPPGKRFGRRQGKGKAFSGDMSLMFNENTCPLCARSGRFRSQLFPITDVLPNRKLMFFNNLSPVRKATNDFHGVISVVASAECPLMLSQLRLPDSP